MFYIFAVPLWIVSALIGVHNYRQAVAESKLPCHWTVRPTDVAAVGIYYPETHQFFRGTARPAVLCWQRSTFK